MHIQKKISPNIGTLLNGVLRPELLNNPFLLPHIAHFDNTIVLPLLVFETFGFSFSVFLLQFKQCDFIFLLLLF